jgi:glucose-1-phosphate thymidylyltransferase
MSLNKKVIGIIPAGGRGTRLSPFPCPKELFPVGYQDYEVDGKYQRRPKVVSQYLLENMVGSGVEQFLVIISEGKDDIMKYYGNGSRFNTDISYLYQENPSGMPNAIDLAYHLANDSTVLFGMPDTIIEPKDAFSQLLASHHIMQNDLTLGLFETDTPSKFGMVEIDLTGKVLSTVDKPIESSLTHMWGCCCWGPSFTSLIHEYLRKNQDVNREIVLGDIFNEALSLNFKVGSFTFESGQYIDIGTSEELDKALKKFHI